MPESSSVPVRKELSTEHIRRGVHYRRSDQDVDNLATAADVLLETEDALFPSHSSILGLNSSVFCDMLASQLATGTDGAQGDGSGNANENGNGVVHACGHRVLRDGNKTVVHLNDETRDVKQLLRFLYDRHSSKHGLDLAAALRLLSTAHKYGVPSLAEMCLGRVLEFWPLHADGCLLVHESVQEGLGCRHGSLQPGASYEKEDEFDVYTWWRAAQHVDECGGMLNRCKAIFAILLASNALVNLNKCYSETFVEEFEVDGGHRVTEPRSDMCLILFSEVPKQCEVLESKGVPKQDCLEIGWMVSWLLRSVKGNNADSVCCICGDERTPSPEVRICALCPTKLRPFWW